ncbi:MAG: ATP-binding cassette domain-containing protein [Gammaproteobacteria bacterium]|nr:ATP-binding cassette domain-containing protein [Gammaproteobacteria bacterium]
MAAAESIAISGASGAGKSQFLRALVDLDPHDGEMWLNGIAASSMDAMHWRRLVHYIPAESGWWAERVSDHLGSQARQALPEVGFSETILSREVRSLSSGERQRLALLRALEGAPQVLLLDEASANIDPENQLQFELLVKKEQQQRQMGVIWVTHDVRLAARVATRRLSFSRGTVDDDPAALLKANV